MTSAQHESRIKKLEQRVEELQQQLLTLALKQTTIIYSQPTPAVPYTPNYPTYPNSPVITFGDLPSIGGTMSCGSGSLSGAYSGKASLLQ